MKRYGIDGAYQNVLWRRGAAFLGGVRLGSRKPARPSLSSEPIQQGAYLMVHGPLKTGGDGAIIVKASKVKNYSQQPEMEASWYLHVMRLHSEVYPTPPAARPHEDTTMHAWHGADDHDEGYESPELV
jgi:hypothetical protein